VKFPLGHEESWYEYYNTNRAHTQAEIRRIKQLRKFRVMRRHLPRIYYYDPKSSVLVISYHPPFENDMKCCDATGRFLGQLIYQIAGVRCTDIRMENIHQQGQNAVLIDLGY
jgi:tRNA A-37 threonylcarbamoyl transferase component Bud32